MKLRTYCLAGALVLTCLLSLPSLAVGQAANDDTITSKPIADVVPVLELAVDAAHNNRIAALSFYAKAMQNAGLQLRELVTTWTQTDLLGIDVLWVDGGDQNSAQTLAEFTPAELEQATRFVAGGGALVVSGCGSLSCTSVNQQANRLLAAVGATTRLQQVSGEAPASTVSGTLVVPAGLVATSVAIPEQQPDLGQVALRDPALIQVQAKRGVALLQSGSKPGSPIIYGALEPVGSGYVTVFGSSLFVAEAVLGTIGFDNVPFAAALAGWLAERAQLVRSH